MILRSPNSDFDHESDQILVGDKIPSMHNLVTRLLQVSTLVKDENSTQVIETSTMVAPCARGGHSNREWRGSWSGHPWCTQCPKKLLCLHGFSDKAVHLFKSEKGDSKFSNEVY